MTSSAGEGRGGRGRTTQQVVDDHLALSLRGEVEEDLARNYAEDVTIVSNWGVEHGHEGARRLARLLQEQVPGGAFTYRLRLVAGEVGMLQWTADSPAGTVRDGVDSYLVRDGRIQAQTIFYSVQPGGAPA